MPVVLAVLAAINLDQGFQEAWNDIAGIVPKLFVFGVVLIAGFTLANLVSVYAIRLLRRVGFDRAVDRSGIGRALAQSRFDATELLGRVVLYALLLFTLQLAFGVFGDNPVSDLLASMVAYLPKVFVAIVIVVVAAAIAAGVRDIVASALSALSYGRTLATTAAGTIVTIGCFAALSQLDIAPAIVLGLFYALLAVVAGSAIVAIGGAGIQPMRSRWERALQRIESEAPHLRASAREAMADRTIDLSAEERARWEAEHAQPTERTEPTAPAESAEPTHEMPNLRQ
jgi:hypothetical protein